MRLGIAFGVLMLMVGPVQADSEIVYQTIAMEAAGEPMAGQIAVARVILNRARATRKPLEAICKAPKQFSCWNRPKDAIRWLSRHFDSGTRLRAIEAFKQARNAKEAYPTMRHYHAKGCFPAWARGKRPCLVIGNHLFYEGIK